MNWYGIIYPLPQTTTPNFLKKQLDAKWQAISEYKSQGFRNYKSQSFIEGLARVRGTQVGCEFAEAFELIRWID